VAINLTETQPKTAPAPESGTAGPAPPKKSGNFLGRLNEIQIGSSTVSLDDKVLFTQQLALLLQTGNSLLPSIHALGAQVRSVPLKKTLQSVHARLEEGAGLSECLARHPKVFDSLYVSIVRGGEASGALQEGLERLAHMLQVRKTLQARIREAMTYPMVITGIMVLVVGFMMFYMFPRFEDLFVELGDELPMSTRILLGTTNFLRSRWWIALPILIAVGIAIRKGLQSPAFRHTWDHFKLRLPGVGRLFYSAYLYQLFSSLGLLLSSKVPHLEAIEIARHAVKNAKFEVLFNRLAEQVEAGRGVAAAFQEASFLPEAVRLMLSTGESSGALDTVLTRLSDRYREELESDIKRLSTLIEPVMLVGMGLVVGFIAVSFIMPLFKLSRTMH